MSDYYSEETFLKPNSTWKHSKGGTYTVLGVAVDSTNKTEGRRLVVYVSHEYQGLRTREVSEFLDGRFEPLLPREA